MPDEEAFSLLVRLMHSYDLRGHFLPEMPKLQLRMVSRHFLSLVCPRSRIEYDIVPGSFATFRVIQCADMIKFDRLVEEILPVLHVHFLRQGIKSSMYCSQWFLTMFSYK